MPEDIDLFAPDPAPVLQQSMPHALTVKFKLIHPDANLPHFASAGAACFDLCAVEDAALLPTQARSIRTGLCVEIPNHHVMLVFSRSGHGFKHGVRLVNGVGVVDSDFRGEVAVGLHNEGRDVFTVRKGDRIAQAMVLPIPWLTLMQVDSLGETERGEGGFGSTGA